MTATLATAAMLLVPFLTVVFLGALAVAVHDAIAPGADASRRATASTSVAGQDASQNSHAAAPGATTATTEPRPSPAGAYRTPLPTL